MIAKVKLEISPGGVGNVCLNGVDISTFTNAIELKVKGGCLTEVLISVIAELEAEIEGEVSSVLKACAEQRGEATVVIPLSGLERQVKE